METDNQTPAAPAVGCADLFAELRGLLRELDELSYDMLEHPKADALCGLIEKLQQWGCCADKHDWQYDQCGYWQHQYCIECSVAKYPDMAKQSCGVLTAKMGKMTEAEYLSVNSEVRGGGPLSNENTAEAPRRPLH